MPATRRKSPLTIWLSSPSATLTVAEREALLASAFQINYDNLLNRYPRFRELWEKSKKSGSGYGGKGIHTARDC